MNTRGPQDKTRDARTNIHEGFFNSRGKLFRSQRYQMNTRGRRDDMRDARMNIHESFFNPRESFSIKSAPDEHARLPIHLRSGPQLAAV